MIIALFSFFYYCYMFMQWQLWLCNIVILQSDHMIYLQLKHFVYWQIKDVLFLHVFLMTLPAQPLQSKVIRRIYVVRIKAVRLQLIDPFTLL